MRRKRRRKYQIGFTPSIITHNGYAAPRRSHTCSFCNYKLENAENLQHHMNVDHPGWIERTIKMLGYWLLRLGLWPFAQFLFKFLAQQQQIDYYGNMQSLNRCSCWRGRWAAKGSGETTKQD